MGGPNNTTDPSRPFKIFCIGTVIWLLIHAVLFSRNLEIFDQVPKYRNYVYMLWLGDLGLSNLLFQMFEDDKQTNRLSRDDTIKRIQDMRNKPKPETKRTSSTSSSSPFIQADEYNTAPVSPPVQQTAQPNQQQTQQQTQQLAQQPASQPNEPDNTQQADSDTEIPLYHR